MRVGRGILAASAVAAAVGAAVLTPILVRLSASPELPVKPPKITVTRLGPSARGGVIGAGTVNGKPWQFRLHGSGQWGGAQQCDTSRRGMYEVCDAGRTALWESRTDRSRPAYLWGLAGTVYGRVQRNVTRVDVEYSDGAILRLYPVRAFGSRWIAVAVPPPLRLLEVIAYAGKAEIEHSGPFLDFNDAYQFLSWLPPGDDGPARKSTALRAGGVTFTVHTGPWGSCIETDDTDWCYGVGDKPVNGALEGGGGLPRIVPMAFAWPASYLKLVLSNGSVRRVPLVQGAGIGFAVIRAARSPRIVSWAAYDPRGRELHEGTGAPGSI